MSDEGWPHEQGQERRSSAGFLVTQVVLGVLAILIFLWLVNVLLAADNPPVFQDMVEIMSRNAWIGVCLGALVILLIAEILLLRPTMREAVMDRQAWVPQPQAEPDHLIGCPGCGTVFDADAHGTDTEGTFGCPNCGRVGQLRQKKAVASELKEIDCPKCQHHYQAYQDESECPNCGQHVRVKAQE